jgi:hypothetical protein
VLTSFQVLTHVKVPKYLDVRALSTEAMQADSDDTVYEFGGAVLHKGSHAGGVTTSSLTLPV